MSQVFPTGDVRVGVNGMNWTFNPACLALAPGENPPEVPGGSDCLLLVVFEIPRCIVGNLASMKFDKTGF